MRIVTYKAYVDENQHNFLVRERSTNYPAVKNLNTPAKIYEVMKNVFHLHELAEEEVYLICLNSKNVSSGFFMIGKGTVNSCHINTRDIFIRALLSSAVYVILCHNHPSQNTTPSAADIQLTKKIKEAGALLDIPLLDHIIISKENYFSFSEAGLL